jgi:DNA-3-methyladenine glycosylase II
MISSYIPPHKLKRCFYQFIETSKTRRRRTVTTTENFTLKCVPPFSFNLSVSLFSNGDAQIRRFQDGKFRQVICIDGQLVLTTVEDSGTIDNPRISVKLESNRMISSVMKNHATTIIEALFDIKFNPKPFYQQASKDRILKKAIRNLWGLRIPSTATVFEALLDSIIEQQISLDVAHVLETNVVKTFGDILKLDDREYFAYPTPKRLSSANIKQLRSCGLSTKKAEYLIEISKLIRDGKLNLEDYRNYTDTEKIIEELDKIRGIGVWTAELTIARSMHRYDTIPADDLGLRRVIAHYYCHNRKITGQQARKIADKWGKWKGLAAFYLIIAEATENTQ